MVEAEVGGCECKGIATEREREVFVFMESSCLLIAVVVIKA